MSFADASAALEGAIAEDVQAAQPGAPEVIQPTEQAAPVVAIPEGQPSPEVQPHHSQSQQRDPATGKFVHADGTLHDVAEVVDTFDGGDFNPDLLPPELQAGWKQLQAAFTRSTQRSAEERKRFEAIGDPNEALQALELYRSLQDPGYLTQFHSELTKVLEARGLSPMQASTEAARTIENATSPSNIGDALSRLQDDPELAPLVSQVSQMQQELDTFKRQQADAAQNQELQRVQMALAGELQRQDMAIRQTRPDYADADMDIVYELSAFFDGSLFDSQQRLESYVQSRIEKFVNGKQSAQAVTGSQALSGNGTSEIPVVPVTLDDARRAAEAFLREGGIDHIGL